VASAKGVILHDFGMAGNQLVVGHAKAIFATYFFYLTQGGFDD
jgi:hypothetical protein